MTQIDNINKERKKKKKKDIVSFNVRMSIDNHLFLRLASLKQKTSMNEIINRCVEKYKNKSNNNLTDQYDAMVSCDV